MADCELLEALVNVEVGQDPEQESDDDLQSKESLGLQESMREGVLSQKCFGEMQDKGSIEVRN